MMLKLTVSLLLVVCSGVVNSRPAQLLGKTLDIVSREGQIDFLERYGYMQRTEFGKEGPVEISEDKVMAAVKLFQEKRGLTVTGVIDEETLALMKSPRCGLPDVQVRNNRAKRFAVGSRYFESRQTITYRIVKYSKNPSLKATVQQWATRYAFHKWSTVSRLQFQEVGSLSDIEISFVSYDHGDNAPFDGPGNVLAHAYYPGPGIGGDMHVDDSESWSSAVVLAQVMAHEVGHALGLAHSDAPGALMQPYFSNRGDVIFSDDDIRGINEIYKPLPATEPATTTTEPAMTTTKKISGSHILCTQGTVIEAITSDAAGDVHIFTNGYYAKLSNGQVESGYPMRVGEVFPGVPDAIDAALYLPAQTMNKCVTNPFGGKTCLPEVKTQAKFYLFSGHQYYMFENSLSYQKRYTESGLISTKFPGVSSPLDSAFTLDGETIHFTIGDIVYKVADDSMQAEVSKLSETVKGMPQNIGLGATYVDYTTGVRYYFRSDYFTTGPADMSSPIKLSAKRTITSFYTHCR